MFSIFYIVQMVPNRAQRLIWLILLSIWIWFYFMSWNSHADTLLCAIPNKWYCKNSRISRISDIFQGFFQKIIVVFPDFQALWPTWVMKCKCFMEGSKKIYLSVNVFQLLGDFSQNIRFLRLQFFFSLSTHPLNSGFFPLCNCYHEKWESVFFLFPCESLKQVL